MLFLRTAYSYKNDCPWSHVTCCDYNIFMKRQHENQFLHVQFIRNSICPWRNFLRFLVLRFSNLCFEIYVWLGIWSKGLCYVTCCMDIINWIMFSTNKFIRDLHIYCLTLRTKLSILLRIWQIWYAYTIALIINVLSHVGLVDRATKD